MPPLGPEASCKSGKLLDFWIVKSEHENGEYVLCPVQTFPVKVGCLIIPLCGGPESKAEIAGAKTLVKVMGEIPKRRKTNW